MLFAFFGLWETIAVGAGAVSVPIIIHLLNRRRYRIVVWAAMRFLLAAQKQNTRRLRIEQLILLLVRVGVIALIVLAMASVTPWAENVWAAIWPEGGRPGAVQGSRIHHVIVLDGSLSMNLNADGQPLFERARQLALSKIKQAATGDGFSVLLMRDNPTWIVGAASQNTGKVIHAVEEVRCGHGNAALAATLNMVSSKLSEAAPRFPSQMVYFFTDLQRATWSGLPPSDSAQDALEHAAKMPWDEIQKKARTVFVDAGQDDAENLAVTDLIIDEPFINTGMEAPINAVVQHFGKRDPPRVQIELLVGKAREAGNDVPLSPRVVAQQLVANLRAGERRTIDFKYKFPDPGAYAVQVQIRADGDNLELDNVRSAIIAVKDTIPVILVNGKSALDRFDRATEYLRLALNPFPRGAEPKSAPLRPKVVEAARFGDVAEEELLHTDLIVLCDVGQFGPGDLRRFDAHVRRGGGLMVALGEKALENLDAYNRLLYKSDQGLLPAQLFKKVVAPADHQFTLHAQDDQFIERPLKEFKNDDDRVSLKSGRFRMYVEAKAANDSKVRTIMTFMPELVEGTKVEYDKTLSTTDPAILEWNPPLGKQEPGKGKQKGQMSAAARYRGKVVLFTSTLNMDWNTWPGSPSYGALMQELTRVAVSGRLREHAGAVGSILEEFLPSAGGELDATIHFPETKPALKPQKTRTQLVEEVNVFRWTDTDVSGLYRVVLGNGPQEVPFAINVPATTPDQRGSECDLARVDFAKLKELFPGWDFQLVRDARDAQVGGPVNPDATEVREPIGPDIAHWILFLAMILLFAEVVLAWKFGHYSAVHGTGAAPSTGLVMPSFIAAAAGMLFLLLAVVLAHALITGDFLGFLPRILRNFFEKLVGAPPSPPGEESRWDLGGRNVFFDGVHDAWYLGLLGVAAVALVFFTYRAEGPQVNKIYKLLLGSLRIFMIWLMLGWLLPQRDWSIDRQGWPDLVVLIDTSRSMGEPDQYQNDKLRERSRQLGEWAQKVAKGQLPEKIKLVEAELTAKRPQAEANPDVRAEVEELEKKKGELEQQLKQLESTGWRPTRLQLVQALLSQPENDWLKTIVHQRRMKMHFFELDMQGRAIKMTDKDGGAVEITEQDPRLLERARQAIAALEAEGKDSRLGTALRQVIDQYRGASLSAVVMFTDGVTTRDETIGQVGEYAAQKGVPLYLVGIGDDHEVRDLKLHDLLVDDIVYVNDRVVFEARLTGKGYKKDFAVPIVLKVKDKDGKERVLTTTTVKVNPQGKAERFKLIHQPKEAGSKLFIIELEAPKAAAGEKQPHPANLRLERKIEVVDAKVIKVLFVEGQPRYEYRYVKSLLERESPDAKKNKSMELRTFLVDADPDFAQTDKTALTAFPPTQAELSQYDVVILGDVDAAKLGPDNLQRLADFVRGEDAKGKKFSKGGGGLLLIAGALHNPHSYADTKLASVIPIEPGKKPAAAAVNDKKLRLELTPMGRMHPIFRFSSDDAQNMSIMQRLAPLYWWSGGYRLKPLAEVLAVHPDFKGDPRDPAGHDGRLPLVVQQFVGSGRSLFFGFDESWRWRFRDDEPHFNNFWIQTVRYLARTRPTRTDLRLDRQTPYRLGEPIKITVRFPDSTQIPGITDTKVPKAEVKVVVEYRPPSRQDVEAEAEPPKVIQLAKLEGSWGTFEHILSRTREGKYRFRLISPDVSKLQPDGEKPSADATVELPPGELDRLRMNQYELASAAEATQGRFYTILDANELPDDLPTGVRMPLGPGAGPGVSGGPSAPAGPPGERVSLGSPMPAIKLWNQWWMFAIVMFLLTSEWVLRKRKHLL